MSLPDHDATIRALVFPNLEGFAPIRSVYGQSFCADLEYAYVKAFQGHAASSNHGRYYPFLGYLRWLAESDHPAAANLWRKLKADRNSVDQGDMRNAFAHWRGLLADQSDFSIAQTANAKSRLTKTEAVHRAITALADRKFWPHPGRFKSTVLHDAQEFVPSLGELGEYGKRNSCRRVEEVIDLNRSRLNGLRSAAAEILVTQFNAYAAGRELENTCVDVVPEKKGELVEFVLRIERTHNGPLNPASAPDARIIGILRTHCWRYHEGRLTFRQERRRDLIRQFGGYDHIRQFIVPSEIAMISAQVIVLIDSCMNIGPIEQLPEECFEADIYRGCRRLVRISGVKDRADGAVVASSLIDDGEDLPIKDPRWDLSAVRAIEMWKDISANLRDFYKAKHDSRANHLWLLARRKQRGLVELDNQACAVIFADFRKLYLKNTILRGIVFARRNIRTSALQDRNAKQNFNSLIAKLFADHRNASSLRPYISRTWLHEAYNDLIRQFQNLFEAELTSGIPQVGDNHLPGKNSLAERREAARTSGLGFACVPPTQQAHGTRAAVCDEVEHCTACPRLAFHASEPSFYDLAKLNRSLKSAEDGFINRNVARWVGVWLPYLALSDAIIGILRRSHWRFAFSRVEARLEKDLRDGSTRLIAPW